MYYPKTPAELWFFLCLLSVGFASVFSILAIVIYKAWARGRAWLFFVPEVPGVRGEVERKRLTRGEYRKKLKTSKGEVFERIIAQDQAHIPTPLGPMFLIGQSTGWNLVAPSKHDKPKLFDAKSREIGAEAPVASEDVYARMLVSNPLSYEQASENDDFGDFVNATNRDKDSWKVKIALLLFFALLAALVGAGGVVYLILHRPTAATAAAAILLPGLF